ncbi:Semialdehyde dehydrogenase [Trypanosoma melophagium]|uniref:Semialdehyde dehydrogenase n=1 Tax=Trypanosoma melophagium TaxID=715481 RepID=UPI003519E887|nr:Semialdehyde dehydrogenase [Trypanosoma melophagium]
MSSKGKQLSVLIAGATGSTGSELVTRLVSHPDVARVVALSRKPIPVNRWRKEFPHIHTGDALSCLSVISVDWDKIAADASHLPASYLRDGQWASEPISEVPTWFQTWKKMRNSLGMRLGSRTGDAGSVDSQRNGQKNRMMKGLSSSHNNDLHGTMGGNLNGSSHNKNKNNSAGGNGISSNNGSGGGGNNNSNNTGTTGGNGNNTTNSNSNSGNTASGGGGVSGYVKVVGDPSVSADAQKAFLDELLQTSFYKTVFSGHHVAINCLGSRKFFTRAAVDAVDHQYAIAFAKMVRLFNCMVHADPTWEEEILMENHCKKLNSVHWGEIYAACCGRVPDDALHTTSDLWNDINNINTIHTNTTNSNSSTHNGSAVPPWTLRPPERGGEGTLQQFTQVSVMGSSMWSPLPYFRAHGACDVDLLKLFNRHNDDSEEDGNRNEDRRSKLTTHVNSSSNENNNMVMNPSHANNNNNNGNSDHSDNNNNNDEIHNEAAAQERADMLLRRSAVRVWNNTHVTIWRPGLLQRDNQRLTERLFGLFFTQLDVRYFAEVIVDDILGSVEDERGYDEVGSVKIVGGNSVAVRVRMKRLETELNRRDTRTMGTSTDSEEEGEEQTVTSM